MNAYSNLADDVNQTGYGQARNWVAQIDLGFACKNAKTVMSNMAFKGPMRVQRPFYPEGHPCHVYLLHPPGGMVSGDQLTINVSVERDAHALITTPSAGKIYHADSMGVSQRQLIRLNVSQGICEWLPQENIVFDGANAHLQTEVYLDSRARFMGWEMTSFGREAGNHPFTKGQFSQDIKMYRDMKPLVIERFELDASLRLFDSPVGLMGRKHM